MNLVAKKSVERVDRLAVYVIYLMALQNLIQTYAFLYSVLEIHVTQGRFELPTIFLCGRAESNGRLLSFNQARNNPLRYSRKVEYLAPSTSFFTCSTTNFCNASSLFLRIYSSSCSANFSLSFEESLTMCWWQESNPRRRGLHSRALPTELHQHFLAINFVCLINFLVR